MTTEQLFSYANLFALLGWLALLFAPLRRGLSIAVARWVAAILAGAYVTLLIFGVVEGGDGPAPDFSSLAGLTVLFSQPEVLLVGWIHYLAFDLWVGTWIVGEAGERGIRHWLVVPCLLLTFVAGPAGLLLYLVLLRPARGRRRAERSVAM